MEYFLIFFGKPRKKEGRREKFKIFLTILRIHEMKNVWKERGERRYTCVRARLSATLFQIESHEPTWFMACKLGSTTSATLSGKS